MRRPLLTALFALSLAACDGSIIGERDPLAPTPVGPNTPVTPTEPVIPVVELPAFVPAPLHPRLLLASQYTNAVKDLLGSEAASVVAPPTDVAVNGLSAIGASQLSMPASSVETYEKSAFLAAQKALATRKSQLITCTPSSPTDAACMGTVVNALVSRAFRRPATSEELARYKALGTAAATAYAVFDNGVEFVIAALLQSPNFLYLNEVGTVDATDPSIRHLTAWELASRLSFFITNAPPDAALRAVAADDSLLEDAVYRAQAERLAQLPEARTAMTGLFDELLDLNGLEHLSKDAQRFPDFDATLGSAMHEETRRTLVDTAFETPTDFRDIFTRKTSFVNAALAQHYGLPTVTGWQQVTLPGARAGIFTQAGFLSLQSHPSQNSPTYRGRFIRERLLCTTIPAPPPEVSTVLPEAPAGVQQTLRQKIEQHMAVGSSCAGCHKMMDPMGFAFEGFDATGRTQTMDDGLPIDTNGSLDGTSFADATGLMNQLHDDPRVIECMARQVFRQGVGHVDLYSESRPLKTAIDAFAGSGYRYQTLLVELAASDAFRTGLSETP